MYLSRIKLNTTLSKTMSAMVSPNLIHGAIESCDKDGRTRKLWRIDSLRGEEYLLVLTENRLDFTPLTEQFGYIGDFESRCYDGFLEKITDGSKWQFRLKANPVIHQKSNDGKRGKILAHITPTHQEEWLRKQSSKYGFALNDGEWLVTASRWYMFKKNRSEHSKVKILAVTYEGILTVIDAELFRKALVGGIGREKAFGLGMLTVAGIK